MSQQADSPKTFVAGEALATFRRVKISGSTVVYADAGEAAIGTTQVAVASGANIPVRMNYHGGSHKIVAAGIIAAGASYYAANDGKISASASGSAMGVACEASTAGSDVIEVILVA